MDDEFGEADDHDWTDDDSAAETVPCPACGADIYEEAEQCPVCGEHVIHSRSVLVGKPRWYLLVAVLGIIATIAVLSGLMQLM